MPGSKVSYLEHNTMSPARCPTRSARSAVERTNHEATAPPLPCLKVIKQTLMPKRFTYAYSFLVFPKTNLASTNVAFRKQRINQTLGVDTTFGTRWTWRRL